MVVVFHRCFTFATGYLIVFLRVREMRGSGWLIVYSWFSVGLRVASFLTLFLV